MIKAKQQQKILVITGSRAEYGLLYPLLLKLEQREEFDLKIMATGMHLSKRHGNTVDEITQDGFTVHTRLDMKIKSDREVDIAKSMGIGLAGMSQAIADHNPEAVLLLGDRFEILAAACAASAMRVPIVHLEGGHVTEGAMDDAFRHAITKLSHLHFTACEVYRKRIIQLGEDDKNVFAVGSTGLDNFLNGQQIDRDELESDLDLLAGRPLMVVTFHPATLEKGLDDAAQVGQLLGALENFPDYNILITAPNADTGSRVIHDKLQEFAESHSVTRKFVTSLGRKRYASVLAIADCVVGNSSSGLIEAPSFGIGTVNIGSRQDGRIRAETVIDCAVKTADIVAAIKKALSKDFREFAKTVQNPFGDGHASDRIVQVLAETNFSALKHKKFCDLSDF